MPSRLTPAGNGLSYVDANQGRLVTIGPDVLGYKEKIEARWPGVIEVYWDKANMDWVILENCPDGAQRICFRTDALGQHTYDRIQRADEARGEHYDLNAQLEREQALLDKHKDDALVESTGEAGERLFAALKKDGVIHAPTVYF